MRTSRIVKSMSSTSSHLMPNSYGFYRKAEDVEVRFYGIVNAHIGMAIVAAVYSTIVFSANPVKHYDRCVAPPGLGKIGSRSRFSGL